MIASAKTVIFEGAQGVLLDEQHGFAPHTTWSKTTFDNADALLDESGADIPRCRIGVIRCYLTRHGAGPFVTEDRQLDRLLPEPYNADDGWAGRFRRGVLDLVILRYALAACRRVDALAVTHLDRLAQLPDHVCDAYEVDGRRWQDIPLAAGSDHTGRLLRAQPLYRPVPTDAPAAFLDAVASELRVRVMYESSGPARSDKRESWPK
jgi:adenylosuccinate synthase